MGDTDGVVDHLRRALEHAEQAVRCYLSLVLARLEARRRVLARLAAWALGMAALGIIGVVLILSGLARLADALFISAPGLGRLCLGAVVLLLAGVLGLAWARRRSG